MSALRSGALTDAQPDVALERQWARYGDSASGWTGGDGGYSVLAPGGARLWIFGDTFLGGVLPGNRRPPGAPMVHNTVVVQLGATFTTITGGTPRSPHSLLRPRRATSGYLFYAGPALFDGPVLQLLLPEYHQEGSSLATDHPVGSALVRLAYPSMAVLGMAHLPFSGDVAWSSWVLRSGAYTYIYGVEDHHTVRYMHVARVAGTDLSSSWSYFDGSGWSPDPARSVRVMSGVDTGYSVVRVDGVYVLVTRSTTPSAFSDAIDAYFSCSPVGPFVDRVVLYRAPQALGGAFVYDAVAQPGLGSGDRIVIGYSVDPANTAVLFSNVRTYRPRYLEVRLPLR